MPVKHTENRHDYQTVELLDYVRKRMASEDDRYGYILRQMEKAGLPPIHIGATEGKLLQFLAQSCGAQKGVEIGTLGGYSALWITDALSATAAGKQPPLEGTSPTPPSAHLYTFELDPDYAALAKASFKKVGVSDSISVIVGDAQETLKTIEPWGPFDFCFIDADKISYPPYLLWASRHLRKGGIVAADNAYLFGKLHLNPDAHPLDAPAILAMQKFMTILTDRSHFSVCALIPTGEGLAVGMK